MKEVIPILFAHIGNAKYLKKTFSLAKKHNPEKDIILLGNDQNIRYQDIGIRHINYKDFINTELVKEFEENFQYIRGKDYKQLEKIVKFNFLKVFAIQNFMEREYEKIWFFDSDVFILDSLERHEYKFITTDYTTHNQYKVLQGMINNSRVIFILCKFIVNKFKDPLFIEKWRQYHKNVRPFEALTYMRFCDEFHKYFNPRTKRLNKIINNETFDECLFFNDGYELYDVRDMAIPIDGRKKRFKKLFFHSSGSIFTQKKNESDFIRNIVLNMSWTAGYIKNRVYKHSMSANNSSSNYKDMYLMRRDQSYFSRLIYNFIYKTKLILKKVLK